MSDTKKAPLDLVPLQALQGAARVLAHGNTKVVNGKKREPGDFINRPLDGTFFASAFRHTMQLQLLQGIVDADSLARLDPDTDLPAIDHLICNWIIIRAMLIRDGKLPADPGPGKPSTRDTHTVDVKVMLPEGAVLLGTKQRNTVSVEDEKNPNYDPVPGARW